MEIQDTFCGLNVCLGYGMLEWWNNGRLVFKRILSIFKFVINTNFTINKKLHYPGTHYSNIPAFHYSNISIEAKP